MGNQQETHSLSNEEKEKWIDDHLERETTVPRKQVEDTETAIKQELGEMGNADQAG